MENMMKLKPKDNAQYLILNAFYLPEHQKLVIHWVEIMKKEMVDPAIKNAKVLVDTYPIEDEAAAKATVKEILKAQPLPPSYRKTPYGLAVKEIERLKDLLNNEDITFDDVMYISWAMARYMSVVSSWEHDRQN
jgi:hypothetical protein